MAISRDWCHYWRKAGRSCYSSCTTLRGVRKVWLHVKSLPRQPNTWTTKWVLVTWLCAVLMILAHNVPILTSMWMWYRPFRLDFPHAYTVSLLAYLFNWHLCLPVKTTHVHSFHSSKHFPDCPTTSGWIGFALTTSFRLLDEAWVWIWMLYYLYTAISSARLSLCKLYSLYAESPMRAPGHNALLIRFFDFGVIYIVCLFLSYASPLILFLHFFLTYRFFFWE